MRLAGEYGVGDVRVFGSVGRGEDSPVSDVDLLVDVAPGTGLLTLGRLSGQLRELLGVAEDLVPAADLKRGVVAEVLAEAVQL